MEKGSFENIANDSCDPLVPKPRPAAARQRHLKWIHLVELYPCREDHEKQILICNAKMVDAGQLESRCDGTFLQLRDFIPDWKRRLFFFFN